MKRVGFEPGLCESPLERGEGCVEEHAGEHTPAAALPAAPPLKRGVDVLDSFSTHLPMCN